VAVHPPLVAYLSQERADQLADAGLFADDPPGMAIAWPRLGGMWATTVERARLLPEERLDERVAGEWSFVETLRHLIFLTDAWVGDVIDEEPTPYHRWGMPPDFLRDQAAGLGLALDARPGLDETLAVRHERRDHVGQVIGALTPDELARRCAPRDHQFTVAGALQAVMFEEWAHHQYAKRDLACLEAAG